MDLNWFISDKAFAKYMNICLREFRSQIIIPVDVHVLHPVLKLIDSVGWRTTVTTASPFSPILVKEILSNLGELNSTVRVRNDDFQFTTTIVNQIFNTPDAVDSEDCKHAELDQSVSILTRGLRNQWSDFFVTNMCLVYHHVYEVCRSNWNREMKRILLFNCISN
ncbi:Uncharacterized protein Rs2_15451 [Raphanus sativus]|nr:Uncharacterized protein Rs2_15451 [Raphanus sativus]